MAKAQAPRVIDRSAARAISATLSYGTGLEALLCLLILNGEPPYASFEQGSELARARRRGLPTSVSRAIARLRTPHGDPWSTLFGWLAAEHPHAHDVASVARQLERTSPAQLKLIMLGAGRFGGGQKGATYRKAAGDDRDAAAAVRRLAAEDLREAEVEPVLRIAADELSRLVVDAIIEVPSDLYAPAHASEHLERDALDAARQLTEGRPPGALVERFTRGLMFKPDAGITDVVLVPSLVHRPWTLVLDHDRSRVYCYPCRPEGELNEPDLALIAIYRALGDGTRLRILRRLAGGKASVAQIGEQLGLAKSTVHEHLLSLRTAGLVRLPASGGFELVPELPDLNWMLKSFLGLEMRSECETCGARLEPGGSAYICSYECTFCESCAEVHKHVCPNCAGELVPRPRRVKSKRGRHHSATAHGLAAGAGRA